MNGQLSRRQRGWVYFVTSLLSRSFRDIFFFSTWRCGYLSRCWESEAERCEDGKRWDSRDLDGFVEGERWRDKKDGGGEMFFLLNTYNTGPYNPQPPYSIRP